MNALKKTKEAIGKYVRLMKRFEESIGCPDGNGVIRTISGATASGEVHGKIVEHLRSSLDLDRDDDAIRLLLAYELWRVGRLAEALVEYERIVARDSLQASVARRMIEEIQNTQMNRP